VPNELDGSEWSKKIPPDYQGVDFNELDTVTQNSETITNTSHFAIRLTEYIVTAKHLSDEELAGLARLWIFIHIAIKESVDNIKYIRDRYFARIAKNSPEYPHLTRCRWFLYDEIKTIFRLKHEKLLGRSGFAFVASLGIEALIRIYERRIPDYEKQTVEALGFFLQERGAVDCFYRNWALAIIHQITGQHELAVFYNKLCCISYPRNDGYMYPFATAIFPDKSLFCLSDKELDTPLQNKSRLPERRIWMAAQNPLEGNDIRILTGADSTYFCAFAYRFTAQHQALGLPFKFCFHIVNPDERALTVARKLTEDFSAAIHSITLSTVKGADAGYFASARFLEAAEIYVQDDNPLLITDIDFSMNATVDAARYQEAIQRIAMQAGNSALGISTYQNEDCRQYYQWSRYPAGCLYLTRPGEDAGKKHYKKQDIGLRFLKLFRYLFFSVHPLFRGFSEIGKVSSWFIDQNVLAATLDIFAGILQTSRHLDQPKQLRLVGDTKGFMHGIYQQDMADKNARIGVVRQGAVCPDFEWAWVDPVQSSKPLPSRIGKRGSMQSGQGRNPDHRIGRPALMNHPACLEEEPPSAT